MHQPYAPVSCAVMSASESRCCFCCCWVAHAEQEKGARGMLSRWLHIPFIASPQIGDGMEEDELAPEERATLQQIREKKKKIVAGGCIALVGCDVAPARSCLRIDAAVGRQHLQWVLKNVSHVCRQPGEQVCGL